MRIRDTLHMGYIWVSEALIGEVKAHPNMEILGPPEPLPFDENGNLW